MGSKINSMSLTWDDYGSTDQGNVRKANQDAFWISRAPGGIKAWAVADGMGGYKGGEIASNQLVDMLDGIDPVSSIDLLGERIQQVVRKVNSNLVKLADEKGMGPIGSTLIVLVADKDGGGLCLWAGDSRLYRLRDQELEQISRDHSQVQGLLDYGIISEQEAENHPAANIITNAVGVDEKLHIDQQKLEVREGDVYLLCSDGINKELDNPEIRNALLQHGAEKIVTTLISGALENGGRDNITAVCVRVG
jgi:serine/threonine-protein phosphatase Stp1